MRGLRDVVKRKEIYTYIKSLNCNIICLQETHSTMEDEKLWSMQWGPGEIFFSHGTSNARGVCILISDRNKILEPKIAFTDTEGRVLGILLKIGNKQILLVNIYAPNTDSPEFFESLFENIAKTNYTELILVGDYNLVIDPVTDRIDKKRYHKKSFQILEKCMEALDLVDLWRIQHPDAKIYSWTRKGKDKIQGSRIDFLLCTMGIANNFIEIQYKYGFKSDHSAITALIDPQEEGRGPGYWKFNTKSLYDSLFVNAANKIFESAADKYNNRNPAEIWEIAKNQVSNLAKKRSSQIAQEKNQNLQETLEKINQIKHHLYEKPVNETDVCNQLKALEGKIEKLMYEKTQAAAFRSKVRILKESETNSKYFYSKEKANYNKKTMVRLKTAEGKTISTPKQILHEQRKFYQQLYTANSNTVFQLQNNTGKKISSEQKETLDKPITIQELTATVKSLKKAVTPGVDGLNSEFYQFFWPKIQTLYLNALNYAYSVGILHDSARRGVVTLIPKKSKDPLWLKNWRPLTMLTTDYKILAKTLATRLKTVLDAIISPHQTGFMQGRQISSTIRTTIDLANAGKKIKGYLLAIDFEKCFDRIEYGAITGAMKYFNMGDEFIKWNTLLMAKFKSCTLNNDYSSDFFDVTRSCHQGCPAAAYYYLICGECLSIEVQQAAGVNGIQYANLEWLLAQFADDTQLFVDTQQSLRNVLQVLKTMEHNIGFKVNYEKSTAITIGNLQPFQCNEPIVWDPGGAHCTWHQHFRIARKSISKDFNKSRKSATGLVQTPLNVDGQSNDSKHIDSSNVCLPTTGSTKSQSNNCGEI